jgi:hypothetical protein
MPDDKDQQHEVKEERYVEDLILYYQTYVSAVINEIFVGIGISLGQSEKEAYAMAKNDPKKLEKAFFKDVFDKFKNVFKHRIPKFRIKQNVFNNGKPLSEKQWETINKSITDYWKQNTADITEDVVTKAYVLGIKSSKYRKSKIDNTKKTLPEIIKNNPIPDKFAEAYKRYDFKNSEKNAMNKAFSSIAMYVSDTGDGIKQAIRKNITEGINEGKTPVQIASDMYWNIQKETGQQTAESVRKNWNRISATEINSVFEAGILAPEEGRAMESLKTGKGVYFVRVGGTCDWCAPRQGTLVRLVPTSIVSDANDDSLKSMGIDDPNTDIAIWVGKNNVGRKKQDWLICCPAHPYNRASFSPIDLDRQEYDAKLGRVVDKVPESLKRLGIKRGEQLKTPEEKEDRKPRYIGDNRVQYNRNIYEAVDKSVADKKLEQWRKDPSLPIPVQIGTPQYKRIFEEAER